MTHGTNILIVEDDPSLAEVLSNHLASQGLEVSVESRGDSARERIVSEQPRLVLLDLSLPGLDGLSVCRQVRRMYAGPILMLTARAEDELEGFSAGADDFVLKPPRPDVLLARVKALLRREQVSSEPQPEIERGGLRLDQARREAWFDGKVLPLTTAEFDLLWLLTVHAGKTLSRQFLSRELRHVPCDHTDRSMDLRVSRLRQKLERHMGGPSAIKTVRGQGYLFALG